MLISKQDLRNLCKTALKGDPAALMKQIEPLLAERSEAGFLLCEWGVLLSEVLQALMKLLMLVGTGERHRRFDAPLRCCVAAIVSALAEHFGEHAVMQAESSPRTASCGSSRSIDDDNDDVFAAL